MIRLYFVELDEPVIKRQYDTLFSLIPAERQRKIDAFRMEADRRVRLFSEVLIRSLASQAICLKPAELLFGQNEYGKPYLVNDPSFQFNISHTRNALAVGVSNEPIGVDTEKISDADLRIANRVFTERERVWVFSGHQNQGRRFFEVWTKKEAYLKWTGRGFHLDSKSIDIEGLLSDVHLSSMEIHAHMVSVCSMQELNQMETVKITGYDIFEMGLRYLQQHPDYS